MALRYSDMDTCWTLRKLTRKYLVGTSRVYWPLGIFSMVVTYRTRAWLGEATYANIEIARTGVSPIASEIACMFIRVG